MTQKPISDEGLTALQRASFDFFLHETNPANGLVVDSTQDPTRTSIASVGMALAAYPVAVECGFLARDAAAERTLATLRFFARSRQGPEPDATGHKGFYYHFLDMNGGRRLGECELSTIDSAYLLAGALTAARYFDRDAADENEIRTLADELYRRADWRWAQSGAGTVSHGWHPGRGFLPYTWQGYDEALVLYILGLVGNLY